MARKSRKNLPQPEQAMVLGQFPELDEEKIPTAIYGRLSVEDDEDNESMETQIALVLFLHTDILPSECAHFSYPQASVKSQKNSRVAWCKV